MFFRIFNNTRFKCVYPAWNEERQSFIEGSLSIYCLPSGFESIAGGDFLTSSIRDYETGYPSSYSVENVLTSLVQNEVGCPQNWAGIPGIDRATDLFVSYLALDAVCTGVDRHPNNWEVMLGDGRLDLVPSFDHGSSLGGNLSESTRATIAASDFDPNLMKSAFWNNAGRVNPIQAFKIAVNLYSDAAQIWRGRLLQIDLDRIEGVFDRVPDERITATAAKFAQDLLEANRNRILSNFVARETSEFSLLLDIPATITKLTDDREDADNLSLGG